jgi:5-methylcytosine-specific restriction endonuclease McrA
MTLSFRKPDLPRFTTRTEREKDLRRGSRQSRGYDGEWDKLRLQHLAEEPLCRECKHRGYVFVAELVDHILPVRDRPDLRLDRDNLQSLCKKHHDTYKRFMESEARRLGDLSLLTKWVSDPSSRPPKFRP